MNDLLRGRGVTGEPQLCRLSAEGEKDELLGDPDRVLKGGLASAGSNAGRAGFQRGRRFSAGCTLSPGRPSRSPPDYPWDTESEAPPRPCRVDVQGNIGRRNGDFTGGLFPKKQPTAHSRGPGWVPCYL